MNYKSIECFVFYCLRRLCLSLSIKFRCSNSGQLNGAPRCQKIVFIIRRREISWQILHLFVWRWLRKCGHKWRLYDYKLQRWYLFVNKWIMFGQHCKMINYHLVTCNCYFPRSCFRVFFGFNIRRESQRRLCQNVVIKSLRLFPKICKISKHFAKYLFRNGHCAMLYNVTKFRHIWDCSCSVNFVRRNVVLKR